MGEFELIRRHFMRPSPPSASVVLGIGDDAALLQPSPGQQWAISSDMLVAGRHFFDDVSPQALGHKALAVNLSDLAAMGARPVGFTLALALPDANDAWLSAFAQGLFALADAHHCRLIGGDTARGPLNLCITVMGEVAPGQALRRIASQAGDDLYISGAGAAPSAIRAKVGTGASKRSPLTPTQKNAPRMVPMGACNCTPLVYSNDSPGANRGCLPTTPKPLTSW